MLHRYLLLAFSSLVAQSADAESSARSNRVVCAIEAPICARASVQANETVVLRSDRTSRTQERLWSVPLWLRVSRINESGEALLVEVEPFNELPVSATADTVVLRLYVKGELAKEFKLIDFFRTEQELRSALRAPAWAKALGSQESDVAKYLLASGRRVALRLSTGAVVFE